MFILHTYTRYHLRKKKQFTKKVNYLLKPNLHLYTMLKKFNIFVGKHL